MTDNLVKRLADEANLFYGSPPCGLLIEAKTRIEALEAALSRIYAWYPISVTQPHQTIDDMREFARAAFAGEKKDD